MHYTPRILTSLHHLIANTDFLCAANDSERQMALQQILLLDGVISSTALQLQPSPEPPAVYSKALSNTLTHTSTVPDDYIILLFRLCQCYKVQAKVTVNVSNLYRRERECACVFPYVHGRVDLRYGLVIQGELVDLDPVADQLAHDFDLELVQLALTDGVGFGDHWDDVNLQRDRTPLHVSAHNNRLFFP